jgi:hypothetical protein
VIALVRVNRVSLADGTSERSVNRTRYAAFVSDVAIGDGTKARQWIVDASRAMNCLP